MDLRPADNYAFEEHPYWEIWPETRPSYFARRVDNDDDLPVMGNHPHPLIYGHERVHIKHEHRKVIVSIVPEESYWMSLYRMYADQFYGWPTSLNPFLTARYFCGNYKARLLVDN